MARPAQMKRPCRAVRTGESRCGRGVFARRRFASGDTIAEIHGEVIDDPDYGSDYCIDLGSGEVLEPAAPFRYLNHSCQPNCEIVGHSRWDEEAEALHHATWLKSLGPIMAGDELTIDYAWPADSAIPCLCGSANCRGWIVAADQVNDVAAGQNGSPT